MKTNKNSMKSEAYKTIYKHETIHWWYRVRRSLAVALVKQIAKNDPKTRVLDVGCGMGALLKELQGSVDVTGVDMSDSAVQYCKERGIQNIHQGKLPALPFADQEFDVVLALDVLEHVENHDAAMKELHRVLKPGGTLIIFVPAFSLLWGSADVVGQHYRRYTKKTLHPLINRNGLTIVRSTYFNTILFLPILVVRVISRKLSLTIVNELKAGISPINTLLYWIFSLESKLLRYLSFPFGVSLMVVCSRDAESKAPYVMPTS